MQEWEYLYSQLIHICKFITMVIYGLVNLNADQTGWIRQGDNLSYEDVLNGRVGIGVSIPMVELQLYLLGYSLTVGSAIVGQVEQVSTSMTMLI